jgi:hypothetical protein
MQETFPKRDCNERVQSGTKAHLQNRIKIQKSQRESLTSRSKNARRHIHKAEAGDLCKQVPRFNWNGKSLTDQKRKGSI